MEERLRSKLSKALLVCSLYAILAIVLSYIVMSGILYSVVGSVGSLIVAILYIIYTLLIVFNFVVIVFPMVAYAVVTHRVPKIFLFKCVQEVLELMKG